MRRRQKRRSGPNDRGCGQTNNTLDNHRPRGGQSGNAQVLQSENGANPAVSCTKSSRVPAAEWAGGIRRHHRDEEYLRDDEDALKHIVDCKLC